MPPADTRRALRLRPPGFVETGSTRHRRRRRRKCLPVLSSFQRTGFGLPRRPKLRDCGRAPRQLYFLQGNLPMLQIHPFAVNPPDVRFVDVLSSPLVPVPRNRASSFPMSLPRAAVRLGSVRGEGSVGG